MLTTNFINMSRDKLAIGKKLSLLTSCWSKMMQNSVFSQRFSRESFLGVYRVFAGKDIAKVWRDPLLKITQTD